MIVSFFYSDEYIVSECVCGTIRWIILKRGSNPLIIEIIENELILVKQCW